MRMRIGIGIDVDVDINIGKEMRKIELHHSIFIIIVQEMIIFI